MDTDIVLRDAQTLTTSTDAEQAAEILLAVKRLKELAAQADRAIKENLIEWIGENGDLTIGDVRFYVGSRSKVRCARPSAALEAVLMAAGGDLEEASRVLSANAFKPAATRTLIGDDAANLIFQRETVCDLKTGKPQRELKEVNMRFVGGAKRANT